MRYENFNPKIHDTYKVSKLVYDVDYKTFDMLFKNSEDAVLTIKKDLETYEINNNFKVILDDNGQIIGILMAYISKMPHDFRIKALKLIIVDILDYFVLCDIQKNDLYLAEIAIDNSLRGCGIGKQVLNDVIDYAREKNLKRVILDADFRNSDAKRLYEKIGFKVFNKKRLKFLHFERGMYNMEFKLNEI